MIYTFDLMDAEIRSYELQIGMFADDQEAKGAAVSLLRSHRRARAVDIYDVDRKVGRVPDRVASAN